MIKTDTLPQFLRNKVAENDAFGLVEGLCQLLRNSPTEKISPTLHLFKFILKKDKDKDAKTAQYVEEFATPYKAAERGFVDVVIEPKQTRPAVINALAMLASKRENRAPKKHGNIPL